MSSRDAPLWARGVAALLLGVTTWWLLSTQTLRSVVGDSIGVLSLGIVAAFSLRGLQLPLGLWPSETWRARFSTLGFLGCAALFGVLIGLPTLGTSGRLAANLDLGLVAVVLVGSVTWAFGVALVRQRPYAMWFGVAVAAGILPVAVGYAISGGSDLQVSLIRFASSEISLPQEAEETLTGGAFRTFLFLIAIGAASKLVTEELAFRRLLIGDPRRTGLLMVILASVVAGIWSAVVLRTGVNLLGSPVLFGLAAFSAGSLYVLARSLLVSASFNAVYWASFGALALSSGAGEGELAVIKAPTAVTVLTIVVAVVLGGLVLRERGLMGSELQE